MIRFEPMTQRQYDAYLAGAVDTYAAEHIRGGRWTAAEAPAASRAEYARLLPEGLDTPDHYLQFIVDAEGGQRVGVIWYWFDRARNRVFIYDIEIDEGHRRRGYATQALALLEREARALEADRIDLHVFGHNHGARALYETLGFEPTNIMMSKQLQAGEKR